MSDSAASWNCAKQAESLTLCRSMVNSGAAPLAQEKDENGNEDRVASPSPFLAAGRLADTSIFEFFLGVWDQRFASNGGSNSDGDYPIHVACRDPHVSIQAIQLLVNHQTETVSAVDGKQDLMPFHFAAMWDASLEVIFYLLQYSPAALLLRNAAPVVPHPSLLAADDTSNSTTTAITAMMETFGNGNGPLKKKAKTTR
jgi:hypothetical protein